MDEMGLRLLTDCSLKQRDQAAPHVSLQHIGPGSRTRGDTSRNGNGRANTSPRDFPS
jgi:hypothetical protein